MILKKTIGSVGFTIATVGVMALVDSTAGGRDRNAECATMEVRSVDVSAEPPAPGSLQQSSATLIHVPPPIPTLLDVPRESGEPLQDVTLIATGPVLGSMDSQKIGIDVACTTKGALLTATINRAADYGGSSLKNAPWRPRITLRIAIRQAEATLTVTWQMRLTTGAVVSRAETPPYGEYKYPMTLTKNLALRGR